MRSLGDVTLATYLEESGLELEDIYSNNRSWSGLRRATGLPTDDAGPHEDVLLRAVGRLLHVDDYDRLAAYRSLVTAAEAPDPAALSERERRYARMLIASLTTLNVSASLRDGLAELWQHPQVRQRTGRGAGAAPGSRRSPPYTCSASLTSPSPSTPATRAQRSWPPSVSERGVKPPTWQTGVWWDENSESDLLAFTLDKSAGSFSPTTRYRDYAISAELIHWESQSGTSLESDAGRRYIAQAQHRTNVVLFARLNVADRAFWCLGQATYVSHQGERPIAITWRLHHRLSGDLFTQFAAAVA